MTALAASPQARNQRGSASVEFALVALFAFLPLLVAIAEFGRMFYVANTLQEVTRRAAREQVVAWVSQRTSIQRTALFQAGDGNGTVTLPGGLEINNSAVRIRYFNTYDDAAADINALSPASGSTPQANLEACLRAETTCIRYVRASLQTSAGDSVKYSPMVGLFGSLFNLPLPDSTVVMPAEALGLL